MCKWMHGPIYICIWSHERSHKYRYVPSRSRCLFLSWKRTAVPCLAWQTAPSVAAHKTLVCDNFITIKIQCACGAFTYMIHTNKLCNCRPVIFIYIHTRVLQSRNPWNIEYGLDYSGTSLYLLWTIPHYETVVLCACPCMKARNNCMVMYQ